MKKVNRQFIFILVLFLFFLIIFFISLMKIFFYFKYNSDNKKIKESILENHIEYIPSTTEDDLDSFHVDFDALKKENPDTIAYLKVFGTDIDYVVVRGEDNSYYLKHNFYHEWNVSGWIFSDYRNRFDLTDQNLVIFGHNTLDGSMFGSLKNVLSEEWRSDSSNLRLLLVTEMGTYYYQTFSTYIADLEDYYIQTSFSIDEYDTFLSTIKMRSNYDYSVLVDSNDSILTLSSCNKSGRKRIVLHAKLINE